MNENKEQKNKNIEEMSELETAWNDFNLVLLEEFDFVIRILCKILEFIEKSINYIKSKFKRNNK